MFSFHKPKVYRSSQGCCICKAKSSSSRFTDSKKYETDFKECFQLLEHRHGEICNACVLLVKRFKRLPPGNRRHWSHVVDARIGPGIKSMTKFKKRKEEQMQLQSSSTEFAGQLNINAQNIRNNTIVERFGKIFKKKRKPLIPTRSCDENSQPTSPMSSSSDNDENRISDDASDRLDNLECDEEMSPIDEDVVVVRHAQRKQKNPIKNRSQAIMHAMNVIDSGLWKQRKTCCGYLYESHKFGALLIETSEYSMCPIHSKKVAMLCDKKDDIIKLPSAIKSLPPKKQHFLRQCIIDTASTVVPMEQSAPIDYSKNTTNRITNDSRVTNNLHRIRGDAGRVTKKTPKKKLAELNAAMSLIKFCTSNKIANAKYSEVSSNCNEKQTNEQNEVTELNKKLNVTNAPNTEPVATNKYSDNSSDSGYDETLHDTTQLNQIAKIGTNRPVILSNGVKLHVKPENLLLAANLAGVSQTAIQTTQANMKAMNAQKHQKCDVGPVSSQNSTANVTNFKCKAPAAEVNKTGVLVVTPSVLKVTNKN